MTKWFCTECKRVFMAGKHYAECCGPLERFNPATHGDKLVGLSNSWITVWKRWEDHPLMDEAKAEVVRDGNYGVATIFNTFIYNLLDRMPTDD